MLTELTAGKIYALLGRAADGREIIIPATTAALLPTPLLVPEFTAWENIVLPFTQSWRWLQKNIRPLAEKIWRELNSDHFPADTRVAQLPLAQQRFIELIRLLVRPTPTIFIYNALSSFNNAQKTRLLTQLRNAAATIIIEDDPVNNTIADFYYPFNLATGENFSSEKIRAAITDGAVIEKLITEIAATLPPKTPLKVGKTALEILGLQTAKIADVSLNLRQGEILGLWGINHGGADFIQTFTGKIRARQGVLTIKGKNLRLRQATPKKFARAGIIGYNHAHHNINALRQIFAVEKIAVYVLANLDPSGVDEAAKFIREQIPLAVADGAAIIMINDNFTALQKFAHTLAVFQAGKLSPKRDAEKWEHREIAELPTVGGKISLL